MSTGPAKQKTVPANRSPLKLERYNDHYTSYWTAEIDINDFVTFCEELNIPDNSKAVLYTQETPKNRELIYREAKDILRDETALFFRINTDKFALTWDQREKTNTIGFIADEKDVDLLRRVYEETTRSHLPVDSADSVSDFLSEY